jgi:hypothetical protein
MNEQRCKFPIDIRASVYSPGCSIVSPSSVSIVDGGWPPVEVSGETLESTFLVEALSEIGYVWGDVSLDAPLSVCCFSMRRVSSKTACTAAEVIASDTGDFPLGYASEDSREGSITGAEDSCGRGSSERLTSRSCARFGLEAPLSPSECTPVSLSGELLGLAYGWPGVFGCSWAFARGSGGIPGW